MPQPKCHAAWQAPSADPPLLILPAGDGGGVFFNGCAEMFVITCYGSIVARCMEAATEVQDQELHSKLTMQSPGHKQLSCSMS